MKERFTEESINNILIEIQKSEPSCTGFILAAVVTDCDGDEAINVNIHNATTVTTVTLLKVLTRIMQEGKI